MDFKKCTSLFLAFLLLVSNAGLAFNVHYCGGKVASVSSVYHIGEVSKAIPAVKSCCAKEAIGEKDQCCSNKVIHFKGKTNDVIIKVFSFQMDAPLLTPVFQPLILTPILLPQSQQTAAYYCEANAPPLFKLYSQYIFYA